MGRATGLDLMLNGEFIDGIQSWMRMSFLRAEEDLIDDGYYDDCENERHSPSRAFL